MAVDVWSVRWSRGAECLGGKAYGAVADMLLGVTGAFVVDWLIRTFTSPGEVPWVYDTIWGAAALPMGAHFLARPRGPRTESLGHKKLLK